MNFIINRKAARLFQFRCRYNMAKSLVIDVEPNIRSSLKAALDRRGHQTVTAADFDQTVTVGLQASAAPIELAGFRVEGEQQCVVRPEEGLVLAQVWEELRKALTVQEWTVREGSNLVQGT